MEKQLLRLGLLEIEYFATHNADSTLGKRKLTAQYFMDMRSKEQDFTDAGQVIPVNFSSEICII